MLCDKVYVKYFCSQQQLDTSSAFGVEVAFFYMMRWRT